MRYFHYSFINFFLQSFRDLNFWLRNFRYIINMLVFEIELYVVDMCMIGSNWSLAYLMTIIAHKRVCLASICSTNVDVLSSKYAKHVLVVASI